VITSPALSPAFTAGVPAKSSKHLFPPLDDLAGRSRTLDISTHLQDSACNFVAKDTARGMTPKTALEQWIAEQRDRGAVIRCKSEIPPTAECIART
jgi:hypothetical protein